MNKSVLASSLALLLLAGCASPSSRLPAQQPLVQQDMPSRSTSQPSRVDQDEVARINVELAANYYGFRQYDAAHEAITRALEARAENPRALVLAGFIQMELKDAAKAEAYFSQAVQLQPHDPEILHNYATYLCRTGRVAQAVQTFDQALAVPTYRRPGLSQAGAGVCLMKLQRTDEALQRFTEALESEPMHLQALMGVAEISLGKGDAKRAREVLRRYQVVAPATAESLWLEVRIYRALGLKEDESLVASDLRSQFPNSEQTKLLNALR